MSPGGNLLQTLLLILVSAFLVTCKHTAYASLQPSPWGLLQDATAKTNRFHLDFLDIFNIVNYNILLKPSC